MQFTSKQALFGNVEPQLPRVTIAPVCHLLNYQCTLWPFHAPDIVEEPAGKRQEPLTPYLLFILLIRCAAHNIFAAPARPRVPASRFFAFL